METGKTGLEVIYTERYAACFELYLSHRGRNLSGIEREMRLRGFEDFHRRILYTRKERGVEKPGWIEKFGWRDHLKSVPPAVARETFSRGGITTPSTAQKTSGVHPSLDKEGSRRSSFSPPRLRRGGRRRVLPSDGVVMPVNEFKTQRAQTSSFEAWLKQVSPDLTWDWKYQKYIYKYLQRVTDGTCKRLMIFMPPRHGKSELVTVRYAGWRLWNDPKMKIIVSSYNQKLADKFSRSIRKLLSEEEDKQSARAAIGAAPCEITTPSARKRREHPPLLRQGGEKEERPLPSLSKEGCPPLWADGVVTAPPNIQAAEIDARIRQSCDHPQCGDRTVPPALAGGNLLDAEKQGRSDTVIVPRIVSASPNLAVSASGKKAPPANAGGTDRMFPRTRTINTASQWETGLGGGVKAVGVGAGVTGFGGQLIVIDDPVKSRAEAESETYRERLWDWYRNDLYTRLEPGAAVILIQTRWHQDDLAGRLLQEMQTGGDQWEVIDLPALAESKSYAFRRETDSAVSTIGIASAAEHRELSEGVERSAGFTPEGVTLTADPLGRPVGAALCPARFNEAKLADIRRQLGGYNFAALYQQHPTPAEGGIFKRAWFTRFVDRAPEGLKWKRGYDLAVSTKTNSCYTASFRVARDEATGNLYIADGFRERIEYPDQKRFIIERLTAERDTEHGIEKALHGQALIQELRRKTRVFGVNLRGIDVTVDKVTRALTWAPLAEEGKVILISGDWNRAFLDELANFPSGQHDDQIDAVSLAFSMLETKGRKVWGF